MVNREDSDFDKTPDGLTTSQKSGIVEVEPPPMPSLADYIKFGLPCLGLWIAGPLLSLVDTICIGMNAKSVQQVAALGPATTL